MSIQRIVTIDDLRPDEIEFCIWNLGSDEQAELIRCMASRAFDTKKKFAFSDMTKQLSWMRDAIEKMDAHDRDDVKRFVKLLHEYVCENIFD